MQLRLLMTMKPIVMQTRQSSLQPKVPGKLALPFLLLLALVLALALTMALTMAGWLLWPTVRAHLQTVAVLDLMQNRPVPQIAGDFAAQPIGSEEVQYSTPHGTLHGRVYFPLQAAPAPGVVLLHGMHSTGMNDARLMSFAGSLAACGLSVLTPDLPAVKDYQVNEASIRNIGDSVVWFAQQVHAPVGVIGLSFSGGLALLAATRPTYAASFKFLLTVGAYDDLARVSRFYLTGQAVRPDGSVERLTPHEYGALVVEYEHLEEFVAPADVAPVRAVLRAHLDEDPQAEAAAMAGLTPAQQTKARQMMDSRSPVTLQELAQVEKTRAAEMAALSPQGKLAQLTVTVYLLHGAEDNIVPAAESLWLARQIPRKMLRALLISPMVSHVGTDGERSPGIMEEWRLVHFLAQVMEAAGRH